MRNHGDPDLDPEKSINQKYVDQKSFCCAGICAAEGQGLRLVRHLWQCGSGSRRAKSERIQFHIRNNLLTKKYI